MKSYLTCYQDEAGFVVVTESLENLNISRDYTISRVRVYVALHLLFENNPLYKDVTNNHFARLELHDIILVIPSVQLHQHEQVEIMK